MSLCVTFLGTGGAVPTTQRNTSSVFCRREGERFLFDCGEGTQRQMMRFGTGFGVSHIFVSHLHADHTLGIPGLLQTMDFNERTEPLAIHVPSGQQRRIERLVGSTGTDPSFPIRVHGVDDGDVALDADDYEIRAFATDHDTPSVGYALVEDDRKGRFDRERAEELGVPVGPKFQRLHAGEDVELEDGTVVRSEEVVGDPRPGRTLVYTGDTRPSDRTAEVAADADLLIHDATFAADNAERAGRTAHSTAAQAAEIAAEAGAKRLALVHVSSRYAGNVSPIEREAREVFGNEAFVPDDGDELDVPYPNAE
ncbi:ribonuclease Z [Natronomonas sp. CBA1123]|jgi:ribonuclease Z|uniref:ribonuclease Z n=1 Tax=Natronomonas sp. CBA1123 TaxID=2668070 RepID=UPI0012EA7444|nr:ribonuclease Z [Natronomonas sp. CBA1123]MUV85682.1 ribonuclease Z [Natronomonas sp. CBA1123]